MRVRMRAEFFNIIPPDRNHDYWFIQFHEDGLKNDVQIEIVDITKFKETLDQIFSRKEDG